MKIIQMTLAASVLASMSLMNTAAARDADSGFYLTPFVGYTFFDGARDIENELTWGVGAGYEFNRVFAFEIADLWMNMEPQDKNDSRNIDAQYPHGNFLFHFTGDNEAWRPYLLLGAGEMRVKTEGADTDRDTVYDAGLGIKHEISENMDLRVEARGLYGQEESTTDGMILGGITFLFGGSSKVEEPMDSDGDGVYDEDDRCPNTPPDTKVDASGCPLPIGDEDQDGVTDDVDQCPGTPRGARVDSRGCPERLMETVSMRLNVQFDTGSARIQPEFMDDVDKLAKFLTEYPGTHVIVEGHTDNRGSAALNQRLSEQRASEVRRVLIDDYGIAADRVTAIGYGLTRPIADNNTAEGRQENRRVVAVVNAEAEKTE